MALPCQRFCPLRSANDKPSKAAKQAIGLKLPALPRSFFLPMPKPKTTEPTSYEAALQELEQLVVRIESGQLPLDQLLAGYQRGAQLLKFCRDKLEAVETQIKVLEGAELKPWAQA